MLIDDAIQLFLPTTVHLVALILILCVYSFRHRETRLGRARYVLLALFLGSYALSTPAIANALVEHLEDEYPAVPEPSVERDALIVVLSTGSTVNKGESYEVRLDAAGWERTLAGIRLWKRLGGKLLFVGEPAPDGRTSVAAFMSEVARDSGVPADAIQLETKSRNTYENLLFTRDLIASHGDRAWLVTSALHMRRAMAVARKLGLRPRPYPCDYRSVQLMHWYAWIPNSGGPAMFAEALHELVGLGYYHLKGYAN